MPVHERVLLAGEGQRELGVGAGAEEDVRGALVVAVGDEGLGLGDLLVGELDLELGGRLVVGADLTSAA